MVIDMLVVFLYLEILEKNLFGDIYIDLIYFIFLKLCICCYDNRNLV